MRRFLDPDSAIRTLNAVGFDKEWCDRRGKCLLRVRGTSVAFYVVDGRNPLVDDPEYFLIKPDGTERRYYLGFKGAYGRFVQHMEFLARAC